MSRIQTIPIYRACGAVRLKEAFGASGQDSVLKSESNGLQPESRDSLQADNKEDSGVQSDGEDHQRGFGGSKWIKLTPSGEIESSFRSYGEYQLS